MEQRHAQLIRLPKELHKKLKSLSDYENTSMNKIIETALEEYFTKNVIVVREEMEIYYVRS